MRMEIDVENIEECDPELIADWLSRVTDSCLYDTVARTNREQTLIEHMGLGQVFGHLTALIESGQIEPTSLEIEQFSRALHRAVDHAEAVAI